MIDTLSIATDGYICDPDTIQTLPIATQGYICVKIDIEGIIIIPRPIRRNVMTFPIDGDIQIFIQKSISKTTIE